MERANEARQVYTEKIMSMSEELSSASEKLDVSKEELHALNVKLSTVNNRLQDRVGELEKANNNMAILLECMDIAAVFLDSALRIKVFTPAATKLFNLAAADVARSISDISTQFNDPDLLRDAQQVLQGVAVQEKEIPTADGKWWSRRIAPYRTADDRIDGAVITFVDVTKRESEKRFRLMADAAPVMIWMSGTDQLCTWFNKPWLDFAGRPIEQELGNGWTEGVHADDFNRCVKTYSSAFEVRKPFSMEYRLKRHDGEYRWLLDNGVPLYGTHGEFFGYIGSCIDISERRAAEESVAAAYRHLTLAMSAGRMVAWTWDPYTDVVTTSENLQEICGLSSIESREHGTSLLHPEDRGRHNQLVDHAVTHRTPYQSVVRLIRPDNGQVVWLDVRAVPVKDSDGNLTKLSGVAIDVTERKQSEQALVDREARLEAILDTAMDAIITIDQRGIIQSANAAAAKMFGYTIDEMLGQNVVMLMPSPHREAHDSYLARYVQSGERHIIGSSREVVARRRDGTLIPTELAVSEIKHLKLFTGIHRDLTERRQLERDVVETASLEQRRIGQDLHDSVAQELTALNMLARDLTDTVQADTPRAAQLVERLSQGLHRTQRNLRAVLRGLLPVAVDSEGLMTALEDLARRTQEEGKVGCVFNCPKAVSVADNLTATHLYLIAQEAVYNAVKHARARSIRITLVSDRDLNLRIQDDGVGMPAERVEGRGLGLRVMRNRAAIIRAQLTFEPAAPSGTVVACRLPRSHHGTR
jgi:PAS domain S-box-containing protein